MDCSHVDMGRIVDITDKELIYLDDRWDRSGIDLWMCRNRYLKYVNSHLEDFPGRNGIPIKDDEDFRCVGDRQFSGANNNGNPYFEFYEWTDHIRFEIKIKRNIITKLQNRFRCNWKQKYYKQFSDIQRKLLDSGWQTFDLD